MLLQLHLSSTVRLRHGTPVALADAGCGPFCFATTPVTEARIAAALVTGDAAELTPARLAPQWTHRFGADIRARLRAQLAGRGALAVGEVLRVATDDEHLPSLLIAPDDAWPPVRALRAAVHHMARVAMPVDLEYDWGIATDCLTCVDASALAEPFSVLRRVIDEFTAAEVRRNAWEPPPTPAEWLEHFDTGLYTLSEVFTYMPESLVVHGVDSHWPTLPPSLRDDLHRSTLAWIPGTVLYSLRGHRMLRTEEALTALRAWIVGDLTPTVLQAVVARVDEDGVRVDTPHGPAIIPMPVPGSSPQPATLRAGVAVRIQLLRFLPPRGLFEAALVS